jgi:hypothetical protein
VAPSRVAIKSRFSQSHSEIFNDFSLASYVPIIQYLVFA